jgi:hypothetical protein
MCGQEPVPVAGDAGVGLCGQRLAGDALAEGHADTRELCEMLAQVPAPSAPVADHPLHLLDQAAGSGVLAGRMCNGYGDGQRRHEQLQVVDRARSWQELPGQHGGGVDLAAPQQDLRLDLVGHL